MKLDDQVFNSTANGFFGLFIGRTRPTFFDIKEPYLELDLVTRAHTRHRPARNRACCPETCRVLEQVPNMIQAMFWVADVGNRFLTDVIARHTYSRAAA